MAAYLDFSIKNMYERMLFSNPIAMHHHYVRHMIRQPSFSKVILFLRIRSAHIPFEFRDLFDAKTQSLVWRGIGQNSLSNNGGKNQQTVGKAVTKMFNQWPKS